MATHREWELRTRSPDPEPRTRGGTIADARAVADAARQFLARQRERARGVPVPDESLELPGAGIESAAALTSARAHERNLILRRMPLQAYARLFPALERVAIHPSDRLGARRNGQHFIYFPETAVIAVSAPVAEAREAVIGVIGTDGTLGWDSIGEDEALRFTLSVTLAGEATRAPRDRLLEIARRSPNVDQYLDRATLAFHAQLLQTAACNLAHPVRARCARWLLMLRDASGSDRLRLTHRVLATLLGVRRAGATIAAGQLQRAKLIQYSRGHLSILNATELERRSCPCYRLVRDSREHLLG